MVKAEPGSGKRPSLKFQELEKAFPLWDPRLQNLYSQVQSTKEGRVVSGRCQKWREFLEYRELEIRISQVHQQAERIGICRPHLQRPIQPSHRWPDPLPLVIERNLLALPPPPPQDPPILTGSPSHSPLHPDLCHRAGRESGSEAAGELAAAQLNHIAADPAGAGQSC